MFKMAGEHFTPLNDPMHSVIQVTLTDGTKYIIDISGAQFGIRSNCAYRWPTYRKKFVAKKKERTGKRWASVLPKERGGVEQFAATEGSCLAPEDILKEAYDTWKQGPGEDIAADKGSWLALNGLLRQAYDTWKRRPGGESWWKKVSQLPDRVINQEFQRLAVLAGSLCREYGMPEKTQGVSEAPRRGDGQEKEAPVCWKVTYESSELIISVPVSRPSM